MIENLLPQGVVSVEASAEMWETRLLAEEQACVAGCVEKRRREFAAGRNCARRALKDLGIHAFPLLPAADGCPQWPSGIVGSITHSEQYCAAAVARADHLGSLGIDAELSEHVSDELADVVCTPAEARWCRRSVDDLPWPAIIFSAKESVFKASYSLFRRFLDFSAVEIEFEQRAASFCARIQGFPGKQLAAHQGRFLVTDNLILTAVAVFSHA